MLRKHPASNAGTATFKNADTAWNVSKYEVISGP